MRRSAACAGLKLHLGLSSLLGRGILEAIGWCSVALRLLPLVGPRALGATHTCKDLRGTLQLSGPVCICEASC